MQTLSEPAATDSHSVLRLSVLRRKAKSIVFRLRAACGYGALPNAIIAGVTKGGTTSLFSYLTEHPSVCGSRTKEVHFFDNQFDKGVKWYRANFAPAREAVILEASPYYFYHPLAPARAASVVPNARLIFVLRNPIDRAYSHWNQNVELGLEPMTFEGALAAERTRVFGTEQALEAGTLFRSLEHQTFSYLGAGHYAKHLRRWLDYFPREQMLILKSDNFFEAPHESVASACAFLGIPSLRVADLRPKHQRSYPLLPNRVRRDLEAAFAEYNAELRDLAGFSW